MSGLFRRLSGRRSDGPEDPAPRPADEAGTADAATTTPAEPGGHRSLLSDPAAPTRVLPQSHAVDPSAAAPWEPGDPRAAAFPAHPAPAQPDTPSAHPTHARPDTPPTHPAPAHADAPTPHAPSADPAPAHPDSPYPGPADADALPTYAVPDPADAPPASPAATHPETPTAYPVPYGGAYTVPARGDVPDAYAAPSDVLTPSAYGTDPAAQPLPAADLPAGLDPDELADAPSPSARRGKLRRRIAFLRAARELLLRDLGGFVYELHRTAHDIEADAHRRLRETKIERLSRIDAELNTLEMRLDDVRRQVLVREPGVGGECPNCTELYASAAHYCSNCGLPLSEGARRAEAERAAADAEPALPVVPDPEPRAASPADQPTEELSPLDPDYPGAGTAEFRWPRRTDPGEEPTAPLDESRVSESGDAPGAGTESADTGIAAADAPAGETAPVPDAAAVAEPDVTPAPAEPAAPESGQDDPAPTAEHADEPRSAGTEGADATGESDEAAAPDDPAAPGDAAPDGDATPWEDPEGPSDEAAAPDDPAAPGDAAPDGDATLAEDPEGPSDEAAAPDDPPAPDEAAAPDDAATAGRAVPEGDAAPGEDSSSEDGSGSRNWAARDDDSYVDPVERRP